MTEVRYILNVADKLHYACRMARKAFMQSQKLAVVGLEGDLRQLDQMLWNTTPTDFVAHSWDYGTAGADKQSTAPSAQSQADDWSLIALVSQPEQAPHTDTLLSLLPEVPKDFSRYAVLFELVSQHDESDKQQARQRWRYYQQRGYVITSHDLMKGQKA